MNLPQLQYIVMRQASEKSWGTTPTDIIVSEKIALLHSELSEAYAAYLSGNIYGKDGFHEEIGDTLTRALHLAGIFGMNVGDMNIEDGGKDSDTSSMDTHAMIAKLHILISQVWEHYRKNRMDEFKVQLRELAHAIALVAEDQNIPLEEAIHKKLEMNKERVWKNTGMNEKFA